MNLANKLTIGRIAMAFLFMWVLLYKKIPSNYVVALGVFILAWITDVLDGLVARRYDQITNFGKLIDPLSDKILMSAAFISFVQIRLVPAWIVVVIISREFIITGMRLLAASRGKVISAGYWGKHKTTSQMFTITLLLIALTIGQLAPEFWSKNIKDIFPIIKYIVLYITLTLTVLSGVLYMREHRELLRNEQ